MKKKKGCLGYVAGPLFLIIILFGIIGYIINPEDSSTKTRDGTEQQTEAVRLSKTKETGVTGIEVRKENKYGEIEDFDYDIVGNTVKLDSYDGKAKILEIHTSYTIDNIEYDTDISDFHIGIGDSNVKAVIFDEGFTEVANAVFNSTDVQNVFFPKSMANVYDYTLSYLHPDDNGKIKIYYAGTQEEWLNIFTEYKRTKVGDAWDSGDASAVGAAIADKLNELMGSEYDSAEFEYFFSAAPDDLMENFD